MPEENAPPAPRPKRPPRTAVRAVRAKAAADIGRRLVELRENLARERGGKLSLAEVCKAIRAAAPQLSDYENGKKIPGAVMLDRLADFYGVSTDYLIRGTDSERARAAARGNRALTEMVALLEKLTPEQLAAIRPTIETIARANEQTAR